MAPISFNDLTFLPNHPEIDKSAPVISKNGSSISFVVSSPSSRRTQLPSPPPFRPFCLFF